jgi:hypothetical protein
MIDGSLKKANYTYTAVALDRGCGKCTAYDDNGAIIGEITGTIDDITGEQKRFFNGKLFQHFDGERWIREEI